MVSEGTSAKRRLELLRGLPSSIRHTFGKFQVGEDVPHEVLGGRRVAEDVGGRLAQAGKEPVLVKPGVGVAEGAQPHLRHAVDLLASELRLQLLADVLNLEWRSDFFFLTQLHSAQSGLKDHATS